MKFLKFLLIGILFGIIAVKSEIISWYRIYEMFKFGSFHMYGVIGSAVALGIIMVQWMKRGGLKNIDGNPITFNDKAKTYKRYILGGIIFGLGWALAGACPGPMFTLLGSGYSVFLVVIAAAVAGTFAYGMLRKKLPH
jgi:hypothetical protein